MSDRERYKELGRGSGDVDTLVTEELMVLDLAASWRRCIENRVCFFLSLRCIVFCYGPHWTGLDTDETRAFCVTLCGPFFPLSFFFFNLRELSWTAC